MILYWHYNHVQTPLSPSICTSWAPQPDPTHHKCTVTCPNQIPTDQPSPVRPKCSPPFLSAVSVDPDNLLPDQFRLKFQQLLQEYDRVFDPKITGYNGTAGPIQATVNIGPVQPPQRKGHIPQYSCNQLVELQAMFDELEQANVFRRPKGLGITVEYLNPSFLVKKPSDGHRLVTAFADVAQYSKPQPSLMPDVNTTLHTITPWHYLIKTDLTQAFYQIPLSQSSLKVLWRSNTLSRNSCLHQISNGYAWLWNHPWRNDVPRSWRPYPRRLRD